METSRIVIYQNDSFLNRLLRAYDIKVSASKKNSTFPCDSEDFPRVSVANIRKRCDKLGAVAKESRCRDTKARLLA